MNWAKITNEEWREFQAIPEQGHSHRAWVDGAIRKRLDQLRTDEAVERVADGLYQHDGSDRRLIDHEKDCVWEQCTMPDSYRREARAVITALFGEEP